MDDKINLKLKKDISGSNIQVQIQTIMDLIPMLRSVLLSNLIRQYKSNLDKITFTEPDQNIHETQSAKLSELLRDINPKLVPIQQELEQLLHLRAQFDLNHSIKLTDIAIKALKVYHMLLQAYQQIRKIIDPLFVF